MLLIIINALLKSNLVTISKEL